MTHPVPAKAAQPAAPSAMPDLAILAAREIAHSYRGDAATDSPLETIGQDLRAALGLRSGQHLLDVAAGNGRVTLAVRHWCASTPKTADALALTFEDADVEALPFADHSFDAVASAFGTTFATNQDRAAAELLRVCKHGGKIGLTSWTPDGFIGQLIKTIASHVPPPAGAKSPSLWGVRPRIEELFGFQVSSIRCATRTFNFHYRSRLHWLDAFRTHYAPVVNAFAALPARGQSALAADLLALADRFNCAAATMVAPADYLEVVITTR